ncbi:hypothetical protein [Capnocytophaga granulosa]|uniref:hypothetical protein n=1 Tax=Capnocytophaga granulosa TaxID=45242 RepID=UPI0023F014DC|nr:hypothetical protein [Capnocytophaga granulosa]
MKSVKICGSFRYIELTLKEIIDSQEYIDIVMSILEITGEKLTERNLMSDQYLREDIKKAAIEGEVLYNFLKDNKLMIIKYAICRQQYNSFKKDISELEGDDFKVVKYLGLNPTFLAYYTIELILLYKGKKVLKDYLKKRNMSVNDVLKNIQNAYNASLECTFSK